MKSSLEARRLGIDTYRQPVVYVRADSPVTRSEGFEAPTRVRVSTNGNVILAILNVVTSSELLKPCEIGLSEEAWRRLEASEGVGVYLSHAPPLDSFRHVRAKIYERPFTYEGLTEVVADIRDGFYPDVHVAAFLTASAGNRMHPDEIVALTRAMIDAGERLTWDRDKVVDKHCVGGLPGNRTTPIVVAIAAAAGLTVPKTSSRAITSPAGTADVMEQLTRVTLSLDEMRRVVREQGGCLAWGGSVSLSPVDDLLIRVERALDIDGRGQLLASVLSKKAAAGSTHVLVDVPWGPTAKVRSLKEAIELARDFELVGGAIGLKVTTVLSDGRQPVGRGIGPALEARDVCAVLRGDADAPADLRDRGLDLAGRLLELGGAAKAYAGRARAEEILDSGQAWKRFLAICEAQGGFREPGRAPLTDVVRSTRAGIVAEIDNRLLARAAKLAGAPADATAGLELHCHLGDLVRPDDPLFTLHAESPGELAYARETLRTWPEIFRIVDPESLQED